MPATRLKLADLWEGLVGALHIALAALPVARAWYAG